MNNVNHIRKFDKLFNNLLIPIKCYQVKCLIKKPQDSLEK